MTAIAQWHAEIKSLTTAAVMTQLYLQHMAEPEQIKRSFLRRQGTLNPRPENVIHQSFRQNEFFDREDLLQVKYEMLRLVDIEKKPVSQAAKTFGFSRPSFYQAQAAFRQAGLAGLLPQKRGPRSGHKLTPELMDFVAQLRAADPDISNSQLAERIAARFGVSVHPRSIDRQVLRQKKTR
jgi:transposase